MTAIPALHAITGLKLEGIENVPRSGAFVLSPNHTSNIDPIVMGVALWESGRAPHFLGKASLFRVPVLGAILRASGQIPVERTGSTRTSDPLATAASFVHDGLGLIIYPEGSLTRDPALWPMRGKTGAVRIALQEGLAIIPAAHWGTEKLLAPYAKFPKLIPRQHIRVRFGKPVDLSAFAGKAVDSQLISEATAVVMAAITAELEVLRGETAPTERWDPTAHGQSETGRF